MRKALLVVLILCSAVAWATGGACTGQKPLNGMTTGGFLKGVANASVRVCSDTLTPCTTIPLYSDAALTQSISNPVTTDATGNYQYCAAAGSYNEQISGTGISGSVNNTPVTLAGSGDVTQAGDNIFTGTEAFRNISNVYYTSPEIDLAVYGNECAAINAAWSYALAKGWTGIRVISGWTGTQHCSTSMFASFPYNFAGSASFSAQVELHPSNTIQTDTGEVIPASVTLWGGSTAGVGVGATIQATSAFYAQGTVPPALIQYGAPNGTTFTGSTPPEGVWLSHINLVGRPTGAAAGSYTPVIGLLNQYAQENSGAEFLFFNGFITGIDLENGGSLNGALNSGPYRHLRFNFDGINSANAQCIATGKTTANLGAIRAFEDYSCNLSGDVVQPTNGITIDSESTSLVDGHTEGFVNGVVVGANHPARNFSLDKLSVVSFAGNPMSNAVLISASNTSSGTIKNVKGGGSISSLKLLTNNLTGETPIDGSTSNAVVTNYAWPAPPTPVSSLSGSTANTSVPLNSFSLNFTGANSVLNLATNGDVQLTPVALATSGGSVGSFKFLQQGSCWNGTAAVADNYAPNIAYAGGANPSGTFSWTRTGGCGGAITFDVSNFSRLKTAAVFSSTANAAVGGFMRMASTELINWRNNAATGDISLGHNTSDQLTYNGSITPQNASATPTVNRAVCWKTVSTLGFCSTQPDATGACTCN